MKYERLTDRDDDGMPYVKCADCYIRDKCDLTKEVCYQELQDRLAELEDKIERGELISTVQAERGEQEIAFFVVHNAEVRKQAIKEFADKIIDSGTTVYDSLRCTESIKLPMERYEKLIKEVCGE